MWKVPVIGLLLCFSVLPLFGMKKFLSKSSSSDNVIKDIVSGVKSTSEDPSDRVSESGEKVNVIKNIVSNGEDKGFYRDVKTIQKSLRDLKKEFK